MKNNIKITPHTKKAKTKNQTRTNQNPKPLHKTKHGILARELRKNHKGIEIASNLKIFKGLVGQFKKKIKYKSGSNLTGKCISKPNEHCLAQGSVLFSCCSSAGVVPAARLGTAQAYLFSLLVNEKRHSPRDTPPWKGKQDLSWGGATTPLPSPEPDLGCPSQPRAKLGIKIRKTGQNHARRPGMQGKLHG